MFDYRYKEIINEAIETSKFKPNKCILFQRRNIEAAPLNRDMDMLWEEALAMTEPHPCVSVEANEPLYILYTSGTTGKTPNTIL